MKTTSLLTGMGMTTLVFLSLYNLSDYGKSRITSTPAIHLSSSGDTAYSQQAAQTQKVAFLSAGESTPVQPNRVSIPAVAPIVAKHLKLELNEIVYIENETEIDLGFDVEAYLPANFDPYAGMPGNLNEISYVENEEIVELGFATATYLPTGFNPYSGIAQGPEDINYLEGESVEIGFDTAEYLPADFDPYSRVDTARDLDLKEILYIEDEEPVEIDFGPNAGGLLEFIPS